MIWLIEQPWIVLAMLSGACIWLVTLQILEKPHLYLMAPSTRFLLVAYVPITFFWLGVGCIGGLLHIAGTFISTTDPAFLPPPWLAQWEQWDASSRAQIMRWFIALAQAMPLLGVSSWCIALLSLFLLTPKVAHVVMYWLPLDPHIHRHRIFLSAAMIFPLTLISYAILLRVQEREPLPVSLPSSSWPGWNPWILSLFLLMLCAWMGAGYGIRRQWDEACRFLGLRWPSWLQWGGGCALGLAFSQFSVWILFPWAVQYLPTITMKLFLWQQMQPPPFFPYPFGMGVLILITVVCVELLFRGALVPRLGIGGSSLLYACFHAEVGFSMGFMVILCFGILLAVLRKYYSTTTAMITHASLHTGWVVTAYLRSDL